MTIYTIPQDFAQAKAVLRDADFKAGAGHTKNHEEIKVMMLLNAREKNIDFERELAERICGYNKNYPYRSSEFLTKFFQDLGFSYECNSSNHISNPVDWVNYVLLELDIKQIAHIVENGLFKKKDYKNENFRQEQNYDLSHDGFLNCAIRDFKDFINESLKAHETVDLGQLLGLNLNTELLFTKVETKDNELNDLVNDATERFLRSDEKKVALEKLWDAFERVKTYYGDKKNDSVNELINTISVDLDQEVFNNEFKVLTTIGNEYNIRHHEISAKILSTPNEINYLFYRMLVLIHHVVEGLGNSENGTEI